MILELIDIVSRGGNLLLNVGPTADGRIPVIMQERLLDIGNWLAVNGEAIYGSRKYFYTSQKGKEQVLYFTSKKSQLFCIFTNWDDQVEINLAGNEKVKDITFLGYNEKINWVVEGNKLKIEVPKLTIDEIPCTEAWTLKIQLDDK